MTIVDAGVRKPLELQVVVPVDDMSALGEVLPLEEQPGGPAAGRGDMRTSIWPAIYPRILELIRSHRSTIVFTNSRRLSERLAQRLNELAGEELVRAHHGSIAREQRLEIEEELKDGRLPALVATSSLELASTWARWTSSSRSSRRPASPAGCSASAGPVTRWARRARASSSRSTAATCSSAPWSTRRMHEGAIETTRDARATRSTCSPSSWSR